MISYYHSVVTMTRHREPDIVENSEIYIPMLSCTLGHKNVERVQHLGPVSPHSRPSNCCNVSL